MVQKLTFYSYRWHNMMIFSQVGGISTLGRTLTLQIRQALYYSLFSKMSQLMICIFVSIQLDNQKPLLTDNFES